MTPELILLSIGLALVFATISIVQASEFADDARRRRRFVVLGVSAVGGVLAMVPVVTLLSEADWSWLALGPLLGCAAVALGPLVSKLIAQIAERRSNKP